VRECGPHIREDAPKATMRKAGIFTPTMGGLIIIC